MKRPGPWLMRPWLTPVAAPLIAIGPLLGFGVAEESAYVGLEQRALKALSDQQVEDYLEGRGMGMALAAELNGYPGPKHVLELAAEVGLTEAQHVAMREIFERMRSEAVEVGREIVERERALDRLFAEGLIEPESLTLATEEIGRLNGRLRGVHLAAHLAAEEILLPAQHRRYMEARGYGAAVVHDPSRHHR